MSLEILFSALHIKPWELIQALAVAQTAQAVDKAVDIVGSFARFVETAQAVVGTAVVAVELAVPIADTALLSLGLAAPTADTDQPSLVASPDHWDHMVDNSWHFPPLVV